MMHFRGAETGLAREVSSLACEVVRTFGRTRFCADDTEPEEDYFCSRLRASGAGPSSWRGLVCDPLSGVYTDITSLAADDAGGGTRGGLLAICSPSPRQG